MVLRPSVATVCMWTSPRMSAWVMRLGRLWASGGFEFAGVFAELGWDPVDAEGGVDLFFGGSGDEGSVFDLGEGVFAEGVAALEGALAGGDVVHLGAGEVLEGRAVAGLGEQANVDLEAVS